MRVLLLFFALLGSACAQEISLGTECPNRSGACPRIGGEARDDAETIREEDGRIDGPAQPSDDGGGEPGPFDGGPADAGPGRSPRDATIPPRDTSVIVEEDAGPALFPDLIRNPSFELVDGGSEGELPGLDLIGFGMSPIAPWYTCRPVGTRVESRSPLPNGPDGGTEGATFVTYTLSISSAPLLILDGLSQNLGEPLRSGQRYAFAIDAWSELNSPSPVSSTLDVGGAVDNCVVSVKIGSSEPIEPGGWKKVCVSFTPRTPGMNTITLTPNTPSFISAVHIDNIRPDPACGNY